MSIHIDLNNQIASPGANSLIDPTLPASFQAAAQAGLSVNDNQNNTGRYVITAMTGCEGSASMGSGHAHGYMLKITDTQTGLSVEVFVDPHLSTSAGDTANFQQNGLTLKLSDGTIVQIDPTTVNGNGVSGNGTTMPQTTSVLSNPTMGSAAGISPIEIQAMLAYANGTGPQVNFANFNQTGGVTQGLANSGTTTPQTASTPSNPATSLAAGIGLSEIQAMLAYANGAGPQVNFTDYNQTGSASTGGSNPVSNTSPQVAFAPSNQTT